MRSGWMAFGLMACWAVLAACPEDKASGGTDEIAPETGSENETVSEIEPETVSEIEPETVSEIEPETGSEIEPETVSEIEPEIEPETASEIESEIEDETEIEVETVSDTTDVSETTSAPTLQITGVLSALGDADHADGNYLVAGAHVTYLKPALGTDSDRPGFFIQAAQAGPALFVEWSQNPAVRVGDRVTVRFESVVQQHTPPSARKVTSVTVDGHDDDAPATLVQDESGLELWAAMALALYQNEVIKVSGEVTSQPLFSGPGFLGLRFDTTAAAGVPELELRFPGALNADLALGPGCTFDLQGVPVWRYDARIQVSFFDAAEIAASCGAPKLIRAFASSPTSLIVDFDRPIDPSSIDDVVTQFLLTGGSAGLTPSDAAVSGKRVILTTGAQEVGVDYTLTVAGSVTDFLGSGVDPDADTSTFKGVSAPDHLVINEIDYDMPGANDSTEFIEIYNPTDADVSLVGWKLIAVNGSTGAPYTTWPLDAVGTLPAKAYLVVGATALVMPLTESPTLMKLAFASGDTDQLQNGAPDAVRLEDANGIVDALSYEGSVAGAVEGMGFNRADTGSEDSLARCPNAIDSQNNDSDFVLWGPTPGADNACVF